jgi:hypothetical protein
MRGQCLLPQAACRCAPPDEDRADLWALTPRKASAGPAAWTPRYSLDASGERVPAACGGWISTQGYAWRLGAGPDLPSGGTRT